MGKSHFDICPIQTISATYQEYFELFVCLEATTKYTDKDVWQGWSGAPDDAIRAWIDAIGYEPSVDYLRRHPTAPQRLQEAIQSQAKPTGSASLTKEEAAAVASVDEDLLSVPPATIAFQLRGAFRHYWRSISHREVVHWIVHPSTRAERCPNLKASIAFSNAISQWVVTEILRLPEARKRGMAMKFFLKVAQSSLSLGNYAGVMALVGALSQSCIARLKKSWKEVPRKWCAVFDQLDQVVSAKGNFAQIRAAVEDGSVTVPFIGIALTDLTFLWEQRDTSIRMDKVTAHRMTKTLKKLLPTSTEQDDSEIHQRRRFDAVVSMSLDEEAAYQLSVHLEPMQNSVCVTPVHARRGTPRGCMDTPAASYSPSTPFRTPRKTKPRRENASPRQGAWSVSTFDRPEVSLSSIEAASQALPRTPPQDSVQVLDFERGLQRLEGESMEATDQLIEQGKMCKQRYKLISKWLNLSLSKRTYAVDGQGTELTFAHTLVRCKALTYLMESALRYPSDTEREQEKLAALLLQCTILDSQEHALEFLRMCDLVRLSKDKILLGGSNMSFEDFLQRFCGLYVQPQGITRIEQTFEEVNSDIARMIQVVPDASDKDLSSACEAVGRWGTQLATLSLQAKSLTMYQSEKWKHRAEGWKRFEQTIESITVENLEDPTIRRIRSFIRTARRASHKQGKKDASTQTECVMDLISSQIVKILHRLHAKVRRLAETSAPRKACEKLRRLVSLQDALVTPIARVHKASALLNESIELIRSMRMILAESLM